MVDYNFFISLQKRIFVMCPVINIFGFEIQSYALAALAGFVLTALLAIRLGKARNINSYTSLWATLVSGVGIFAGGHLLFAITNIKEITALIQKGDLSFSGLLPFISGMVFYGGFFGALVALLIYCKLNKHVGRKDVFDIFAVSVPLFHAFGRVGCFFAGCCYGVESEFGIVTYINTAPAHYGISRFPVQLVEALFNLLIFALLILLYKRNKLHGNLILVYMSLYAHVRFVLEFFRGDEVRGFVLGFSTSQFISLLVLAFLCIYCIAKFIKKSSIRK